MARPLSRRSSLSFYRLDFASCLDVVPVLLLVIQRFCYHILRSLTTYDEVWIAPLIVWTHRLYTQSTPQETKCQSNRNSADIFRLYNVTHISNTNIVTVLLNLLKIVQQLKALLNIKPSEINYGLYAFYFPNLPYDFCAAQVKGQSGPNIKGFSKE